MPRKKSVKKCAEKFIAAATNVKSFIHLSRIHMTDQYLSWSYEYAILRLYREFESLMLAALVGAINNNTATISNHTGVHFPKHLTDEVCEFLITGGNYFDFKGRDGLIKTVKKYVPDTH